MPALGARQGHVLSAQPPVVSGSEADEARFDSRSSNRQSGFSSMSASNASPRPGTDLFTASLDQSDPEIARAIRSELSRQRDEIELIASENVVSRAVLEAQGSVLTNKRSEERRVGNE